MAGPYLQPTEPSFEAPPATGPFVEGAQAISPPWLMNWAGARYVFCQAIQLDAMGELLRYGVLQRMPEYAQTGALPHLGADKKIFRGLSESDENYAARLKAFKTTWKLAGNAPTLLTQLWELQKPYATKMRYVVNGYSNDPDTVPIAADQYTDWWTIEDDGSGGNLLTCERVQPSNWDWDGAYTKNIRFWVIIYRTDFQPAVWGVPPYDWAEPGLLWGADPGSPTDWVVDTFNIVQTFKAAGSHMGPFPTFAGGLIIADASFTTAPWGVDGPFPPSAAPGYPMPDGTFGDYSNYPPGAVYIGGL